MASNKSDIVVEITCQCREIDVDIEKLRTLAEQICHRFSMLPAIISIAIVDDETIKKVNARFLDSEKKTDVISFDLSDDSDSVRTIELIVNFQQALRQAKKREHSTEAELALYITHGLLHHAGFDDTDADQGRQMHKTEDEILQQAGFDII